jgi:hypothetical protein
VTIEASGDVLPGRFLPSIERDRNVAMLTCTAVNDNEFEWVALWTGASIRVWPDIKGYLEPQLSLRSMTMKTRPLKDTKRSAESLQLLLPRHKPWVFIELNQFPTQSVNFLSYLQIFCFMEFKS